MDKNSIRYVVEQRCKTHKYHEVTLGSIPVSSKIPAKDVQLLIRDVFRCPDCTFHSKFHADQQCDSIRPDAHFLDIKRLSQCQLIYLLVLALLAIITIVNIIFHGVTHPLSVLSMSAFFCILFTSLDAWDSEKISNLQWTAFAMNVMMLIYSFLLLPTRDALDILNKSGVKQNFLQLIQSVF